MALRNLSLPLFLAVSSYCLSSSAEGIECTSPYRSNYVGIRHNEARGVGYKKGYTTLEGFFTSDHFGQHFIPFLDLRGHLFNNGKWAGNVGLGSRSLLSSHHLGGNVYYDVRRNHHFTMHRLGLGLELLGRRMEYRTNTYFAVGQTKGHYSDAKFDHFAGNSLFIKRKREEALSAVDAEVGVHCIQNRTDYDLFVGISPYYLWKERTHAWGGLGRLRGSYKQYLALELLGTYDHLFKGTLQASVALSLPFGPRLKRKGENCSPSSKDDLLLTRAVEAPHRFEIPMTRKQKKKIKAINPTTGAPYTIWFVDNTSHSLGTFESPFPTLEEAEHISLPSDVIYLFPGDGTTTGMDEGIFLKDGQKLFGSATEQSLPTTKGAVTIPALSSQMPLMGNIDLGPAIVLSNGNEVSGIHIVSLSDDVYEIDGQFLHGVSIHNNLLSGSAAAGGIIIVGDGELTIMNNQITTTSIITVLDAMSITATSGGDLKGVIAGNIIDGLFVNGVSVTPMNSASCHLKIVGNSMNNLLAIGINWATGLSPVGTSVALMQNNIMRFNNGGGAGINAMASGQPLCLTAQGNQIYQPLLFGIGIGSFQSGVVNSVVTDNLVVTDIGNPITAGFIIEAKDAPSRTCLRLLNNVSQAVSPSLDYSIAPAGTSGIVRLEPLRGNIGTFAPFVGTVVPVSSNSCSCSF